MSREASPDRLSERTPLIQRDEEITEPDLVEKKKSNRLPSFIALGILCVAVILAIVFGFAAPAAIQEYAKEALSFDATDISIESFTDAGVQVRVQGIVYLDGSKVLKKSVRDLGRIGTWIAKEVETSGSEVGIYLPEYDDALLGIVKAPPIKLNIRDGYRNKLNIVSDVEPGDVSGIRRIAQDFMTGKQTLDVQAVASMRVRSGIFNLGAQTVTTSMTIHRGSGAKLPDVDVANLKVAEYGNPAHPEGIKAIANISAVNEYPIKLDVPPMAFEVMLKDCTDQPLSLGTMKTSEIHILPKQRVTAGVTGLMQQLPTELTQACPDSTKSPLDTFIGSYLEGKNTSIYVRGGEQDPETPAWIGDILREMVVPVPVPVQPFDDMIKNFSMSNVKFSLPEVGERTDPTISAIINVTIGLPKDINIGVAVDRVRADSEVFFKGRKLGQLDLSQWQKSSSSKIGDELHVQSEVIDAPLKITDQDVFTDVLQTMIFEGNGISLAVHAVVDVDSATALGHFVVRQIPADGKIFIKPIGGEMEQTVKDISVFDSSPEELIMLAKVEVNNPTEYSAHIPYVNVSIWCNETRLGYAWGAFSVGPGINNLAVKASYAAGPVATELLSQYISGYNTTLTLKSHEGSVTGLPDPRIAVTVPMPHMFGKFLKETTVGLHEDD